MVDKKIIFTVLVSSILGNVSPSFAMEMDSANPYANAEEFLSFNRLTAPLEGNEGEFGGHTTPDMTGRHSVQSNESHETWGSTFDNDESNEDEYQQSTSAAPASSSPSLATPENPSFWKRHVQKLIAGTIFAAGATALALWYYTRSPEEEEDSTAEAMRQMTEDMTTSVWHSVTQRIWHPAITTSFWECLASKFNEAGKYLNPELHTGYYRWSLSKLLPSFSTQNMLAGDLQNMDAALHVNPSIASTMTSSTYRTAINQTLTNRTMLEQFLNQSGVRYSSDSLSHLWTLVKTYLRSRDNQEVFNYVQGLCGRN